MKLTLTLTLTLKNDNEFKNNRMFEIDYHFHELNLFIIKIIFNIIIIFSGEWE